MKVNNRYKQKYHANVPSGWSNDPNGMIYYNGKVHLFYQHYPHDSKWGPMHWLHMTSTDLVTWEALPIALVPDEEYEAICGCCSGNAIEKDGKLVLMYTAAQPDRQRQCLAVSDDGGITFKKYADNPVLTAEMLDEEVSTRDFRDPKIIVKDGWYYCFAGTRIIPEKHREAFEEYIESNAFEFDPDAMDQEDFIKNPEAYWAKYGDDPVDSGSPSAQAANTDSENEDANQEPIPFNENLVFHIENQETEEHGVSAPTEIKTISSDSVHHVVKAPSAEVLGGQPQVVLGDGNIILFKSKDLLHWQYCGKLIHPQKGFKKAYFKLDGVYECPDFFQSNGEDIVLASPQNLPQDGNKYENVHSNIYIHGKLDFKTGGFHMKEICELDSGFDFYAPQVVKMPDGRNIMIAWKEMWDRSYPTQVDNWVGTYTLPREMEFKNGRLYQIPAREVIACRANEVSAEDIELDNTSISVEGIEGNVIEIVAEFKVDDAEKVGVRYFKGTEHETVAYYDAKKKVVIVDRSKGGIKLTGSEANQNTRTCDVDDSETIKFDIFLDVISSEVFINDGRYCITANVYPDPTDIDVEFFAEGGKATLLSAAKYDIIPKKNDKRAEKKEAAEE